MNQSEKIQELKTTLQILLTAVEDMQKNININTLNNLCEAQDRAESLLEII